MLKKLCIQYKKSKWRERVNYTEDLSCTVNQEFEAMAVMVRRITTVGVKPKIALDTALLRCLATGSHDSFELKC